MLGHRGGHLVSVGTFGDDDETVLAAQDPAQPGPHQILVVDQQHRDLGRFVNHNLHHQGRQPDGVLKRYLRAHRPPVMRRPDVDGPAEQFDSLAHAAHSTPLGGRGGRHGGR